MAKWRTLMKPMPTRPHVRCTSYIAQVAAVHHQRTPPNANRKMLNAERTALSDANNSEFRVQNSELGPVYYGCCARRTAHVARHFAFCILNFALLTAFANANAERAAAPAARNPRACRRTQARRSFRRFVPGARPLPECCLFDRAGPQRVHVVRNAGRPESVRRPRVQSLSARSFRLDVDAGCLGAGSSGRHDGCALDWNEWGTWRSWIPSLISSRLSISLRKIRRTPRSIGFRAFRLTETAWSGPVQGRDSCVWIRSQETWSGFDTIPAIRGASAMTWSGKLSKDRRAISTR